MGTVSLNLSRKWRSQNFDQIVGQDLAVRILKNSLYSNHFFPVYLFSGQRGCGKTSTARVFAAAINCRQLDVFQKDPKNAGVPCLLCDSCSAMRNGNHPDFIEIDAASHTGVDNIRDIIESSSLLPLIGRKRVYLIDEAHMLSKAAFNAALKILEEPPSTALFILATTNPNKIIDTVRSRCFQLFFVPIAQNPLKNHLQDICKKENIAHDGEALDLIVQHTQGSARDALNLLEQVRFASLSVNKQSVLSLLGHMGDADIAELIECALYGTSHNLLELIQKLNLSLYDAGFVWERLLVLLRALLWLKYGVNPVQVMHVLPAINLLKEKCSLADVHRMIDILYAHEETFLKTTQQHIFLETILLSLNQKKTKRSDDEGGASPMPHAQEAQSDDQLGEDESDQEDDTDDDQDEAIDHHQQWLKFVTHSHTLNDPLIESLFKQARYVTYDALSEVITVELSKDFVLFKDRLQEAQTLWLPLLRKYFSVHITLNMQFTGINKDNRSVNKTERIEKENALIIKIPQKNNTSTCEKNVKTFQKAAPVPLYKQKIPYKFDQKKEVLVDVSDVNTWKIASMVLRHFPGVITEVRE